MKASNYFQKNDKAVFDEIKGKLDAGINLPIANRMGVSLHDMKTTAMIGPKVEAPNLEAMIRVTARPALLIQKGKIEIPSLVEVRQRLLPFLPKLEARVPSVGRIDFRGMSSRPFGGTGWMITEDILITNRHVAMLFAEKKGKRLAFRKNPMGDAYEAFIDYKEEYMGAKVAPSEFEVPIVEVLYMTEDNKTQPDIAFVKIGRHASLPGPIPVSDKDLEKGQSISVIGYPAYDPNGIISSTAARQVFGNIYEVKRCSPGLVDDYSSGRWYFSHDCTTTGGSSGSVVLDNATGVAVGLHFMGEVQEDNYAVKGKEILKHLGKVAKGVPVSKAKFLKDADDDAKLNLEAAPVSYDDRKGFDEKFLGTGATVSLPTIIDKGFGKILTFKQAGKVEKELRYQHYSVVMNGTRRMPFFSACNINGSESKKGVARTTWKFDPRIPKEVQILKECYGNPPKFSRGHQTRKEDPIWGTMAVAVEACSDTFMATNICPQMQPFNAPVWLALEDYALQNARQDEMKISVITGPIFSKNDPVKYGVRIPLEFFKVIAFIHDKTEKLCATGYTVSQADYLTGEEFVFGEFKSYQVSIRSIEKRTGLKFGSLGSHDPFKGEEAIPAPLTYRGDIRWV